jgi:hypothetical protein
MKRFYVKRYRKGLCFIKAADQLFNQYFFLFDKKFKTIVQKMNFED